MTHDEKGAAGAIDGARLQAFLAAGADLLQTAVDAAKTEDAAGVSALAAAVKAGAMLRLGLTLSAAGVAWINVEVVEPNGAASVLAHAELRRPEARH